MQLLHPITQRYRSTPDTVQPTGAHLCAHTYKLWYTFLPTHTCKAPCKFLEHSAVTSHVSAVMKCNSGPCFRNTGLLLFVRLPRILVSVGSPDSWTLEERHRDFLCIECCCFLPVPSLPSQDLKGVPYRMLTLDRTHLIWVIFLPTV